MSSLGIPSRRIASICHWGEPVQIGVGAPHDVVGAEPPDELAEHRRADARVGHRRLGEDLAEVGVDVGDP